MKSKRSLKTALTCRCLLFAAIGIVSIFPAGAQTRAAKSQLTEDQRILHALNRLTFGARPGDFERVKAMGLDKYIEQQLHPETIDDSAVDVRLAGFDSIAMTTPELYRRFPQPPPQVVAQRLAEAQNRDARSAGQNQMDRPNREAMEGARPSQQPGQPQGPRQGQRSPEQIQRFMNGPQRMLFDLQRAKITRAVYSRRQLQEVMADFWFNHFNVFWGKGPDRWMVTPYERDVIRPNAMGKFKDLVLATAKSPAMLFYLDNVQSVDPALSRQAMKEIDEIETALRNGQPIEAPAQPLLPPRPLAGPGGPAYQPGMLKFEFLRRLRDAGLEPNDLTPEQRQKAVARLREFINSRPHGLNENYARELMELHTMGVDGGYTQKDVTELARCLTGWSVSNPQGQAAFQFNEALHDKGSKVFLGHAIPAGGGMNDGVEAIGILLHHPSTAKFIARKLALRFVSDTPPQSLVDELSETYKRTDGDIRAMLDTLFHSPEFFSPEAYRAKVKKPFVMVASALRALNADTSITQQILQSLAQLGEPLYLCQPPTGYKDNAEAWVSTGSLLIRMNLGIALAANRVQGTRVRYDTILSAQAMEDPSQIASKLIHAILGGEIAPEMRATLMKAIEEPLAGVPDDAVARRQAIIVKLTALLLGSPDFQRM